MGLYINQYVPVRGIRAKFRVSTDVKVAGRALARALGAEIRGLEHRFRGFGHATDALFKLIDQLHEFVTCRHDKVVPQKRFKAPPCPNTRPSAAYALALELVVALAALVAVVALVVALAALEAAVVAVALGVSSWPRRRSESGGASL